MVQMHFSQTEQFGGRSLLALGLCVGVCVIAACDPENPEADDLEKRAASLDLVEEAVSEPVPADREQHDHDECGFASYVSPVEVRWITNAGGLPELEVDVAVAYGPGDRVQIQFMATPMPAGEVGVIEYGEAVSVRDDGRVPMPAELVAAVRSGKAYAAFALLEACDADDLHGNCVLRNSNEIYIEDGMAFLPDDYQIYLREKWIDTKPWLFEDGVVTNVVDMGGR